MNLEKLAKLRESVDEIDRKIIDQLIERMQLSEEIGEIKSASTEKVSYSDPAREIAVIRKLQEIAKDKLPAKFISRIYREIMAESLNRQHPLKVSYLGPVGTFSYEASLNHFGIATIHVPQDNIRSCIEAVEQEQTEFAIVPYENSTEGGIGESLSLLTETKLIACGETQLRVRHNLIANKEQNIKEVTTIYSHPQSFAQCRRWLDANLPEATHVAYPSNSAAAQAIKDKENVVSIGPQGAAIQHQLTVIERDIEDNPYNVTRFLILGKELCKPTGNDKTSIVFSVHDKPGALCELLTLFAKNNLNLTRLESRPVPGQVFEDYMFFIDVQGHQDEEPLKDILTTIKQESAWFKNIGSYPSTDIVG